jgi:predicted RNA binding protein YcfA (HicA-like mRNA interferase family)
VREVTPRLQAEGRILTRTTGSQRICTHPTKPAVVVVAGWRQ